MAARMLCLFLVVTIVAISAGEAAGQSPHLMAPPQKKAGFFSRMKSAFRWRSPFSKRKATARPLSEKVSSTESGFRRTRISREPPPDLDEQIQAMHREGRTPPSKFTMGRSGKRSAAPSVTMMDREALGLPSGRPRSK